MTLKVYIRPAAVRVKITLTDASGNYYDASAVKITIVGPLIIKKIDAADATHDATGLYHYDASTADWMPGIYRVYTDITIGSLHDVRMILFRLERF